jgi:hypothetical protein
VKSHHQKQLASFAVAHVGGRHEQEITVDQANRLAKDAQRALRRPCARACRPMGR